MADTTLPGVLLTGDHASRPAANTVSSGTLYACSTHSLIYQSDASSWSTWADLTAVGSAPNPTTIELGHASDTTLARVSAGVVSIEGTNIVKAGAVTTSGLTQATAKMLGRSTASTGAIEEITVGTGLSLAAGTLSATGSAGNWTRLADVTHGSDTASFDFTSISGSYKHLMIILLGRSTAASTADWVNMTFNADTGTNYDYFDDSSGTASTPPGNFGEGLAANFIRCVLLTGASSTAGDAASGTIWIPHYAGTTFNKSAHGEGYATLARSTGNTRSNRGGGTWESTAAITRVTLTPNGGNWKTGSRATLYGLD